MEGLFDALGVGELLAWIGPALAEARAQLQDVLRIWTLIQLGLIAAAFGVAALLAAYLRAPMQAQLRRIREDRRTLRVLVVLLRRTRSILFTVRVAPLTEAAAVHD